WTAEAKERLKKIPGFVRPMATAAILRYCLERGHSMITSSVITEACESILPAGAMQAMYSIGDQMRDKMEKGQDPLEGMIKDRQEMLYEKFKSDAEKHSETDGREVPATLKCRNCGAFHAEDVVKCGVCGAGVDQLTTIDKKQFAAGDEEKKDTTTVTTFDSVEVTWTQEALNFLNEFPEGHIRRRAHARIEKNARVQKVSEVSLEFARQIVQGKSVSKTNGNGDAKDNALSGRGEKASIDASAGSEFGPPDEDGYTWAPEAVIRLEQVPKGFMRDNTRSRVIDYARKKEISHIDYDACVKGIEYSVQIMSDMIKSGASLEDFLPDKK
ncbi:MAG: PCP reductase family protein, partial [Nitrospinaceae bacterium]